MRVLIDQNSFYPLLLEQRVSKLSANINLPQPQSGLFSFRLIRLPKEGVETVVDLYSHGSRFFLKLSRILHSLRSLDEFSQEKITVSQATQIPVEVSYAYCDIEEPLVREIRRGTPFDLNSNLSGGHSDSHYFVFYTDSHDCIAKGITNPFEIKQCELWTRLITYSYGVEQLPPRRFYQRDALASS
jgi:hypothetical protein